MDFRVITLTYGELGFAVCLAQIRQDPILVAAMWADAESRPAELDVPGTRWSVALVNDGGQEALAAWCAAVVQSDGTLKCHSNYEVPRWRGLGAYEAAYRERHRVVVIPSGLPAITYLFAGPIGLHEADGWRRTGVKGTSREAGVSHKWWELQREPSGQPL